ncbi:MAG: beta strand repeat-containing protein [Chthoniobacteraceae bacterium]
MQHSSGSRPLSLSIATLLAASAVTFAPQADAADFRWDADPDSATVVATDGAGIWDLLNENWISAGVNTTWLDDPANFAIFGGGVDAPTSYDIDVELDGFGTAAGLRFENSGYVLTSDELHTVTLHDAGNSVFIAPGKTATIGENITLTGPAAAQNTTLTGGGLLVLENGGSIYNSGSTNSTIIQVNTPMEIRTGGALLTSPVGNAVFVNAPLTVEGGEINSIGTLGIGSQNASGVGELTIESGTVTALSTNGIRYGGGGATAGGTINLNGGTLTARFLQKGAGAVTSILNLNGGTLQASTSSQTAFLTGLGRTNVRDGGAVIDSNGRNITIAQALEHSNISGDAATDGGLVKLGLGTLTLSGTNTYNGGTVIEEGALLFNAGALPAVGAIKVNGTGSLVASGAFATVSEVLADARFDATSTGSLALAGDSAEDINFAGFAGLSLGASAPSIYSGTLAPTGNAYRVGGGGSSLILANENAFTGANNLRVSGPGTVIVANTNDYTGTTTITSGTLQVGDGVFDGSINETSGTVNDGTLVYFVAGEVTSDTAISGSGRLEKRSTGTLILAGDNSYSGVTDFANGVLRLAHSNALGDSSVSGNTSQIQLQLAGGITVDNQIRLGGSGLNTTGILKNVEGTNTLTDFGFPTGGGTRISIDEATTLRLPNAIALSGSATAQSFRVIGGGTLFLGGDNTAAINAASSFFLGGNSGQGPIIQVGNDLAFGAGTIDFQAFAASTITSASAAAHTIANPLTFSDSSNNQVTFGAAATGDLTFSGPATLNGDLHAIVENATTSLTGAISGSYAVIKDGAGSLVLGGSDANTHSGGTTVMEGLLTVQKDGGLGSGDVTLLAGGSLKLELGTLNNYISDDGQLLLSGTGSTVALAFTGASDVIAGLSFDQGNTFVTPGVWGSLTSDAEFKSAAFTGPGTLTVVPEPATAMSLLGGLGLLLGMRRRRA